MKDYIRRSLIEQGRILFSKYGLQKTTIHEITNQAGIAVGTFYNYYQSKEELYFDILEQEEHQIKSEWLATDFQESIEPKKTIKNLLLQMIDTIETNPLIRQLYFDVNLDAIMSKLPKEKLNKHLKNDTAEIEPLIKKWQDAGVQIDKNPEFIAGVLRALFLLTLHKHEIGATKYKEVIAYLTRLVVDDLIQEEE